MVPYQGTVTIVGDSTGTTYLADAGFVIGATVNMDIVFDEHSKPSVHSMNYFPDAISHFTVSNGIYTKDGQGGGIRLYRDDPNFGYGIKFETRLVPDFPGDWHYGATELWLYGSDPTNVDGGLQSVELDPNEYEVAEAKIHWTLGARTPAIPEITQLKLVPEPTTILLLGAGLLGLAGFRRKKFKK